MQKKILGILGIVLLLIAFLNTFDVIILSSFRLRVLYIIASVLILYSIILDVVEKRNNN